MQIPGTLASPGGPGGVTPSADNSSSANGAIVTANDFLTLLVTELKNQDPTANQDPNAYVNQLVQVNSLQQLIQISQNTNGSAATPTPASVGSGS
jgi:flagellar basal-body rod modification protein FlgD